MWHLLKLDRVGTEKDNQRRKLMTTHKLFHATSTTNSSRFSPLEENVVQLPENQEVNK